MKSMFTDAEREAMRLELKYGRHYSAPTHSFHDSIDYTNNQRYGTNANGTKYEIK